MIDSVVQVELARWVKPFVITAAILHLPQSLIENVALRGLRVRETMVPRKSGQTANVWAYEGAGE